MKQELEMLDISLLFLPSVAQVYTTTGYEPKRHASQENPATRTTNNTEEHHVLLKIIYFLQDGSYNYSCYTSPTQVEAKGILLQCLRLG